MKIGEMARQAGVSPKAVRRYEELGLITPRRLANGYRDFDEADVRIARELRSLRELGITAERTRPFLQCLDSGAAESDECPSSLAEYASAIEELTARITELTARRAVLQHRLREAAYRNSVARPAMASAAPAPTTLPATLTAPCSAPTVLPTAPTARTATTVLPTAPTARTAPTALPAATTVLPTAPVDQRAPEYLRGRRVPALALPATSGGTVRIDRLGAGRTVLYLYPLTGRPDRDLPDGWKSIPGASGCTPQACGFRDHHRLLLDAGADAVYGLSSQDGDYQRELVERLGLPFAMLSDPGFALAAALGLPTFEAAGMRLYRRLTLIVRDQTIEHVFHPVPEPGRHADQVLAWLAGR